ncbi:helix-turn-helix domain-containing protein [Paenibacillus sp. MBLB4367]|uniref:helix-turn-helix domain-containing protein n=1 Tax=Paenibacillus sp. MBLB4367 TaxID=3384767 RepID=UPI0039083FFA
MDTAKKKLIQNYFGNTAMKLLIAQMDKVSQQWRFYDMKPEYNRLYFIREGEGWIKINNREYYPQSGELVLMPAGAVHSISVINENSYRKYWCHFTALVETIQLFQLIELPYIVRVPDEPYLERLFQELIASYASRDLTSPLRRKTALYELLRYFFSIIPEDQISLSMSPSAQKLNTIFKYIEEHLDRPISVEQLAKLVHYNTNYFTRFFKSKMNMTPVQYLNKVRIEKAKTLLTTTDLTLSEIGEQVGMEVHYLSRVYKQYTNYSPGEFRNRLRPS